MELHYEASQILARANKKEASVKSLVYTSKFKNLKQLFALVSESLRYQSVLEEVISHCESSLLDEDLIKGDKLLAIVLLYEYLLGRGFGRAGFIRKVIVKHRAALKLACKTVLENHGCNTLVEIVQGDQVKQSFSYIPRYVRINFVKTTFEEAIENLQEEGWIYKGILSADSFHQEIESLAEDAFGRDPLLKDLLVFAPGTDLHNHPYVTSGVLVLQDKASCIPAHVLNPWPDSVVLDCCAAPGNKTCHLASLIGDKGRIIALDRDLNRTKTMKSLLDRAGFTSIEVIHQDFLTISPGNEDASQIELILVDPSCSGSGMRDTHLCPSDGNVDVQRLESLKRFQISILKHALRFPNVQRVVYSTCSIHSQENEEVVEEVMENVKEYFQFQQVFPELRDCRGLKRFLHHNDFLRLQPEKDLTLGFFVACFERIKSSEKNVEKPVMADNGFDATGPSNMKMKKNKKNKETVLNMRILDSDARDKNNVGNDYSLSLYENCMDGDTRNSRKKKKKGKKDKIIKTGELVIDESNDLSSSNHLQLLENSGSDLNENKNKSKVDEISIQETDVCDEEETSKSKKKKKEKKRKAKKEVQSDTSETETIPANIPTLNETKLKHNKRKRKSDDICVEISRKKKKKKKESKS